MMVSRQGLYGFSRSALSAPPSSPTDSRGRYFRVARMSSNPTRKGRCPGHVTRAAQGHEDFPKSHGCGQVRPGSQLSSETARAMTSASKMNPPVDSRAIRAFARRDSGMVSVGLKAMEFDREK